MKYMLFGFFFLITDLLEVKNKSLSMKMQQLLLFSLNSVIIFLTLYKDEL